MSGTGTTTCRSNTFVAGGWTIRTGVSPAPPSQRATSSTGRTVADSPTRCAGRSSRASSRSSERARCAPRLVPARACTSSTITVSTPASDARACDVRSRNSDSGVVMSTSGGVRESWRRSSAGVSPERTPTRDIGHGQAEPRRGLPDAGERGAQVALDVDRERLERGDVEDAAAARGARAGGGVGGEPVERPQERGQRLARPGRRDDERVVAAADGVPRAGLGGGRTGERLREPRPGRRREALQHAPAASPEPGPAVDGGALEAMRRLSPRPPTDGPTAPVGVLADARAMLGACG